MFKFNSKWLFLIITFIIFCSTLISIHAYDKTYTVYMAGNAHIDTAWKWTTSTTRGTYVPNTFNNAINLMNANPTYTFNASAALHYYWTQQDNPTLFNNIKAKVANGQWDIVGGEWVEADTNITGGEALVRQHLYGQRYFNQNFGKYCITGWLPDCFGFTAQLPQILKGCGMSYFATTKLTWNDTNAFPYEIYKWAGIDGTTVIADKPRSNYTTGVDINNINNTLNEPNRHNIKIGLVIYGSGDRGGGPNQSQIDSIESYDAQSTQPNIKMYTADKFFTDVNAVSGNITDVWNGDMPLENHRGTYTSQALIKKNNRFGEIAAEQAEKFSAVAQWLGAKTYDSANIWSAWQLLMLNHFHDILPGSGTNDQVTEAHTNGSKALNTLNNVLDSAVSAIAGKVTTTTSHGGVPIVVFNPLSFNRKYPVETSVTFSAAPTSLKVFDGANELPCQILSTNGNTANIVFIATAPSFGYKVVEAVANTGNYSGSKVMSIGSNVITSDKFQVTIGSNGNISAILDKTNNKQVLSGDGNVFQILTDTPASFDAWNVDYAQMIATPVSTMDSASAIKIVENGPAKCTYEIDKSYGSSTFQIYVTLYAGIDKVDFKVDGSWNESHEMLKTAFTFNVSGASSVMYDVAYGAISRPNTMTKAMFEVPAHKWADLSANNYGVAILNDCKYGYDANGSTIRLSLLRSPKSPDGSADMGTIPEFKYSIYSHTGDWKSGNVMYKGWELNEPLIAYPTTSHTGTLGASDSFFSVNATNVILTCVKKAEDSNDYIIRMYETQGSTASPTITVPGTITSISETDMLERKIGTPSYSGNTFSTSLTAYKIKTFKVNFGGSPAPTPTPTPTPDPTKVLLSQGKPATASSVQAGNEIAYANDGNSSTRWCAVDATYPEWWRVDLGSSQNLSEVDINWNSGATRAYKYKIEVSADDSVYTTVVDNTGNTTIGDTSDSFTATGRYVRITVTGSSAGWASFYECKVYGSAPNLALNTTATANSFTKASEAPQLAVDGSTSTKWCSTTDAGAQWLQLDLGSSYSISRWVVKHAAAGGESTGYNTKDFKLQKSSDGTNWTDVDTVTGNTANITDRNVTPFSSRYVRLYITTPTQSTNTAARIYEFELY